ncbi:response regulator [Panacibacter ginsenosidivorans]|uniref:Response regulator n=1 Tax=Panacibacter ginsenosidivorans TaxID=1813871 RepID=A0A5B8V5K0_9BACT|nr:response regulator [Panacibacter ginsenosidivorans]QEC66001.1 response regulator [Panacibacter ginsenosidivorans]
MGRQVLIIDDDTDTCKLLTRVLLKIGFCADAAYTAKEGIQLFTRKHFDIVLCDYNLGDSNGLDILIKVKEISPDTIVIIMTGYLNSNIEMELKEHGAFDYITKPIYPEVILKIFKNAMAFANNKTAVNGQQ